MMSERAKSKRLQLEFDIAPEVPQFVIADEQKSRQILLNIALTIAVLALQLPPEFAALGIQLTELADQFQSEQILQWLHHGAFF
ncbi:MAG TPA: hypothetical protein V6C57_18100 [Coleofasciculaceae cyanobacterium]